LREILKSKKAEFAAKMKELEEEETELLRMITNYKARDESIRKCRSSVNDAVEAAEKLLSLIPGLADDARAMNAAVTLSQADELEEELKLRVTLYGKLSQTDEHRNPASQ
jgi:hypothetical protein